MIIKGLMLDPTTKMPIVILRDSKGEDTLPIWVGGPEANAIALQIENVATPRPMTHDLLRNVIKDLKGEVQKIVVCDLKENTFYAMIYLKVNGEVVAIDSRPSDAIALEDTPESAAAAVSAGIRTFAYPGAEVVERNFGFQVTRLSNPINALRRSMLLAA